MLKALVIDGGKCTGCKQCEMACSYENEGEFNVSKSRIRVFEVGNKQMYEQPVDKTQYPAALSFLTGSGKLTDTFNFQMFEGAQMKFPGGYVLVGEPKTPTPAYKKVLFYVDSATYQVRRVLILDNQGSKNRFDFSKPRINDPVDAAEFEFEPPAGTTVIKP